jgi:hypothetical protein
MGGRPSLDFKYKVMFTVPEGTRGLHGPLSAPRRAEMFERATRMILQAEGVDDTPENQFRVWCFLHKVPDGKWGGLGTVFRMEDIAATVRDEETPTPNSIKARSALAAVMKMVAR